MPLIDEMHKYTQPTSGYLLDDDRTVQGWMNYNNLTLKNIDPYTPMGPNTLGEYLWPVYVIISPHGCSIGFSYIEPENPNA